jgi:hypothetical protein
MTERLEDYVAILSIGHHYRGINTFLMKDNFESKKAMPNY